jgi:pilus assembly protein CpaB
MTERTRNIVIAVVLAGMAALLTGVYVTNYQRHVRQSEEHATVFVAAKDIPSGTSGADAISHQMLAEKTVTKGAVVPGAISNNAQIAGTIANQTIYAGEQITTNRFSDSAVTGIQGQLKGTMRAFQLKGDPNQLLAGTLRTGDRVDFLATFKFVVLGDAASQNTPHFVTRTVLRNIPVLRASGTDSATTQVANGLDAGGFVILKLTDAQAQKLDFTTNYARREGDYYPTWRLTLRSPVSASDSPESVTTLDSVLLDGLGAQQRAKLLGRYGGGQ